MSLNEIPYWMAFAHAQGFSNRRKMEFLIEIVYEKGTLQEVFNGLKSGEKFGFSFSEREWDGLQDAVREVANYSFLAEKLNDQGIEIVHVMEKFAYPRILKDNLKKDAPVVIYTKGNADLLNRDSIAIVGSRRSSNISLEFTDRIARFGVERHSVIVSGFAKGVDKQALDSALKYHGQSIIVLPQGIDTYKSKTYYQERVKGNVLVISTYHPSAPWSVGLAMDRNKIIYGLAKDIYVAESGDSGGTWEGALNGLKRNRKIFVRRASSNEKNANNKLIGKGAIPVDLEGKEIKGEVVVQDLVSEPESSFKDGESLSDNQIADQAIAYLRKKPGKGITVNEVIDQLNLDKKATQKINRILSGRPELEKIKKGRYNYYHLAESAPRQGTMF